MGLALFQLLSSLFPNSRSRKFGSAGQRKRRVVCKVEDLTPNSSVRNSSQIRYMILVVGVLPRLAALFALRWPKNPYFEAQSAARYLICGVFGQNHPPPPHPSPLEKGFPFCVLAPWRLAVKSPLHADCSIWMSALYCINCLRSRCLQRALGDPFSWASKGLHISVDVCI